MIMLNHSMAQRSNVDLCQWEIRSRMLVIETSSNRSELLLPWLIRAIWIVNKVLLKTITPGWVWRPEWHGRITL